MQVKPTNIPTRVAALKQHLESLFPGKWVSSQELQKALRTGLPTIDRILTSGLVRQRITEWVGSLSSGKTTVLRMVIANWCTAGFHIAYIDLEDKLVASDWSFELNSDNPGRFWVVKSSVISAPSPSSLGSSARLQRYYICDQLLCSNAFDVVILDLGQQQKSQLSNQIYTKLQNSLTRSKAALVVIHESIASLPGWGCHARLSFEWGTTIKHEQGISGIAIIVPTINCSVWKDGLSQTTEVTPNVHVANRLFTHPSVPDRRTPKS